MELHCDSCQARFVAWYGTEEDADIPTIEVQKCGLCGDDTHSSEATSRVRRYG